MTMQCEWRPKIIRLEVIGANPTLDLDNGKGTKLSQVAF